MKKFILKIILILSTIIIIDTFYGVLCERLTNSAIGGDTGKIRHISKDCNEKIIFMGSSRCSHHYIPSIISENLNTTCYNCGIEGNGIITMYGLLNTILEYNTPDIIVYDIIYGYDLQKNDNLKYLGNLKYLYNNKGVKSIFEEIDKKETYKMYSSMYKYNSKTLQLIADNINPKTENENGYKPMYGCMNYEPTKKQGEIVYDPIKLNYIEQFILKCSNKTKLIFTTSPYYLPSDDQIYDPIRNLCKKYSIPFLEHHNDSTFTHAKKYFADPVHLNHEGAQMYTKIITEEIFELLPNKHSN